MKKIFFLNFIAGLLFIVFFFSFSTKALAFAGWKDTCTLNVTTQDMQCGQCLRCMSGIPGYNQPVCVALTNVASCKSYLQTTYGISLGSSSGSSSAPVKDPAGTEDCSISYPHSVEDVDGQCECPSGSDWNVSNNTDINGTVCVTPKEVEDANSVISANSRTQGQSCLADNDCYNNDYTNGTNVCYNGKCTDDRCIGASMADPCKDGSQGACVRNGLGQLTCDHAGSTCSGSDGSDCAYNGSTTGECFKSLCFMNDSNNLVFSSLFPSGSSTATPATTTAGNVTSMPPVDNADCSTTYGSNVTTDSNGDCVCEDGYDWNADETACVPETTDNTTTAALPTSGPGSFTQDMCSANGEVVNSDGSACCANGDVACLGSDTTPTTGSASSTGGCNNGYDANGNDCGTSAANKDCTATYGANITTDGSGDCVCADGYGWNSGETACVKEGTTGGTTTNGNLTTSTNMDIGGINVPAGSYVSGGSVYSPNGSLIPGVTPSLFQSALGNYNNGASNGNFPGTGGTNAGTGGCPDANYTRLGGSGVCVPASTGLSSATLSQILTSFLNWILGIFTTLAILAFVISGIQYLISAGDEGMIEKAKTNAKWSIVGILVGLSGFVILQAVASLISGTSQLF